MLENYFINLDERGLYSYQQNVEATKKRLVI